MGTCSQKVQSVPKPLPNLVTKEYPKSYKLSNLQLRLTVEIPMVCTKKNPTDFSVGSNVCWYTIRGSNTEDDAEDTVIPRFVDAGGDVNRIFFIDEMNQALNFSDRRIGETIRMTGAKLIIFDPLTSYIGSDVSINLANEVRSRMNYLIEVAKETGCAIVIVGHMNKMSGAKAMYRSLGSIDVVGSARSCLLIGTSPEDPNKRIMAVQKSNLAEKGKAIEFCFNKSRAIFIRQLEMTADELVNSNTFNGKRTGTKLEKAKEILNEMLGDGPKPQRDIMQRMDYYDISQRTAENAKAELGIKSSKLGKDWIWLKP